MRMRGHLQQQLLLGTGRTNHELIQSTDCILRQLTLGAEHASTQPSQIEGRFHRELLQMAGNAHFQLLMASSPPATRQYDVSRDVSPSATADDGPQEVTSQPGDRCPQGATPQHGDRGCQGATSQHGDGGRQGAPSQHGGEGHYGAKEGGHGDEERRQEEKEVTQLCDSAHVHKAASQIVYMSVVYVITLTG